MRVTLVFCAVLAAGCLRSGEDRSRADEEVGRSEAAGLTVEVAGGLAHIRTLESGRAVLWSSAPVLSLTLTRDAGAPSSWELELRNATPDAVLSGDAVALESLPAPWPTVHRYRVELAAGVTELTLAPPDHDQPTTFRFAAMADIQNAMDRVDEIFAHISARDDLRFVMFMGDLTEEASTEEYELFERQIETLDIPFYGTIGNHELWDDPDRWRERFGRYNVHFRFKDVAFTFVDSGNGSIDPVVYDWLDSWLEDNRDRVHVFGTHYPAIDPIGVRSGSFRSRPEAARLLAMLAGGNVDLTLYGHIHSYYAYANAGIPAFISGGGGAWPERWDGVGRHYLVVEATAGRGIDGVSLVRVD
jgi:3',5'-cyclic-AMP phosphodiesterase